MSVRLDSVCEIVMGQAPSGDSYNDEGEGLPLLAGAGDFRGARPTAKKFTRQITKRCALGDIVLGIRASIGDKVIADREYCLGRGVAGLRPKNGELDPRYLWHWLTSVRPRLEGKAKGATFKQVNRNDIGELPLSLPSISEQHRISSILDQAEELRAKRRAAIALLDQLPQAIFLEMFGDPVTNSRGWKLGSLVEVSTIVGGGTPSRAVPSFFDGDICWATSKDMKGDRLFDTEEHVTEEAISRSATKLVPPETILIVVKSKILARKLPLAISQVPVCFGQDLKGIVPKDSKMVHYCFFALKIAEKWLLERARGINTEGLTLEHLRAFPLPLPPVDLQYSFAAHIEVIQRAKAAHQSALIQLESLFSSLQSIAFDGDSA